MGTDYVDNYDTKLFSHVVHYVPSLPLTLFAFIAYFPLAQLKRTKYFCLKVY